MSNEIQTKLNDKLGILTKEYDEVLAHLANMDKNFQHTSSQLSEMQEDNHRLKHEVFL